MRGRITELETDALLAVREVGKLIRETYDPPVAEKIVKRFMESLRGGLDLMTDEEFDQWINNSTMEVLERIKEANK